jgi:hypothetical protein
MKGSKYEGQPRTISVVIHKGEIFERTFLDPQRLEETAKRFRPPAQRCRFGYVGIDTID